MKNIWAFTIGLLSVLALMASLIPPEKRDDKNEVFFKRNTDKVDYNIKPLYDLGEEK